MKKNVLKHSLAALMAGAGLAATAQAEPLNIAFAYVGPVGDGGWTFAHDNGRKAVVAEFGKGNFDAPFEQLPGKKAFINNVIETVRGNFRSLTSETVRLADAIENGKLDTNAIGSAREPWGVSKNVASKRQGPELYKEAKFNYEGGEVTLPIELVYELD